MAAVKSQTFLQIYKSCVLCILALSIGCTGLQKRTDSIEGTHVLAETLGASQYPGVNDYEYNLEIIKQLAATPRGSATKLIAQLETVSIDKLDSDINEPSEHAKAKRVIWSLRALYYITGMQMLGVTSYKFTDSAIDDIRRDLIVATDGRVCFFTEWMSRGSVYLAPVDAQEFIINSWKSWLLQIDNDFQFRNNAELNDWYFGGTEGFPESR